jgi:tetratricopeptide (TPR) repeat protein
VNAQSPVGYRVREAWGDDAAALLNLGFLADKKGEYQDAQSYLSRAISAYEKLFRNALEPDLANAHFHLAEVYRHLDQFDLAVEQYQAALKMYEQIEGPNGRNARNSAMGLAIVEGAVATLRKQLLSRREPRGLTRTRRASKARASTTSRILPVRRSSTPKPSRFTSEQKLHTRKRVARVI